MFEEEVNLFSEVVMVEKLRNKMKRKKARQKFSKRFLNFDIVNWRQYNWRSFFCYFFLPLPVNQFWDKMDSVLICVEFFSTSKLSNREKKFLFLFLFSLLIFLLSNILSNQTQDRVKYIHPLWLESEVETRRRSELTDKTRIQLKT